MSDADLFENQVLNFLRSEAKKTALIRGILDQPKISTLIKSLSNQGKAKIKVVLVRTDKNGIENFLQYALLNNRKPQKYNEKIQVKSLSISFENFTTRRRSVVHKIFSCDYLIIWPIQSITEDTGDSQVLINFIMKQNARKVFLIPHGEPQHNLDQFEKFVDCIIKQDFCNDYADDYNRAIEYISRH